MTDFEVRTEEEGAREGYPHGFPEDIGVPAARYSNEKFHCHERRHVFEATWLFAAHEDQIPGAGDYLCLEAFRKFGHPLFLVRGKDGKVRCFYNACQHRGAPIVAGEVGNVNGRLVCGYHAWTYALDGTLIGYPEAKNFPSRQSSCVRLKEVECEGWGKLIFIRIRPGGQSLREHLSPVWNDLDNLIGDASVDARFAAVRSVDVACDWKMPVDANIETYHVPFVHRASAARSLDEQRTAQWLLPNGHSRMLVRFRKPWQSLNRNVEFAGAIEPARLGVYSYHVFPNLSIVFGGPTNCFLISVMPRSLGTCSYTAHFLFPHNKDAEGSISDLVEGSWQILMEDLVSAGPSQAAIAAGAIETMRLQYQERRIRYLHEEIDRRIGVENIPAHLRVLPLLDDYVEAL